MNTAAADTNDKSSSASEFRIRVELNSHGLLVAIGGDLDLATACEVEEAVSSYRGRHDRVDYELDAITFIDCSGLRAILKPIDGGHLDGRLSITSASRYVRRLLNLVEMDYMILA